MAAQPGVHPSEDALRAFALGKLDQTASAALVNHLDDCPACCKVVADSSGDDFLHRLRQAQGRSFNPAPGKALARAAEMPPPASQTPMPHLPPELAANQQYEVVRELGRGGMGVVYLAKNKLLDRLEVLKVINKTLLDKPGSVERFLREIRSAAKLNHANIVTAYSAVQQGDLLAFAMEYIVGQDLASAVKAQGPLPVVHACFYAQQFAGFVVDYLTQEGYTYRVALSIGFFDEKHSDTTPHWGKHATPDRWVDLGREKEYNLDLKKWTPEGWNGRVWFTVSLQNAGNGASLKAVLSFPGEQKKLPIASPPTHLGSRVETPPPGGRKAASASDDYTVRLWRLP